jgi:hypothetical protein
VSQFCPSTQALRLTAGGTAVALPWYLAAVAVGVTVPDEGVAPWAAGRKTSPARTASGARRRICILLY